MTTKPDVPKMIEVAAGVLTDARDRVLLVQRLPGKHLAGLWEFPGGKLEPGETVEQALARELREELGIEALSFAPVISIPWHYPAKAIRLHALRVTAWHGEPRAQEGNPLRWTALHDIDPAVMPPADAPILAALRLPPLYAITPEKGSESFFARYCEPGSATPKNDSDPGSVLQLRLPDANRDTVRDIARDLLIANPALRSRLLLNHDVELARELGVGVHLGAAQLHDLNERPLPPGMWVGASCHDGNELALAARIGVDFATLSPVRKTASHPDAQPLGWERFAQLVADACVPVYALGGVGPEDLERARAVGAQGVAGIRAFSAIG